MTKRKIESLHEAHGIIAEELKLIQNSMTIIRQVSADWEIDVQVDLGNNESHFIEGGWDSSDESSDEYWWASSDDNC